MSPLSLIGTELEDGKIVVTRTFEFPEGTTGVITGIGSSGDLTVQDEKGEKTKYRYSPDTQSYVPVEQ